MKKKVLFLVAAVLLGFAACAQKSEPRPDRKVLVAYFSATGTTKAVADRIAAATGGELYAITPAEPYTPDDLNWNDANSRTTAEMNDPKARPALAGAMPDVEGYDVVYLGFPIWWNTAPRPVNSFLEQCDLGGKTVIPFATSGGSGIANAQRELQKAYPEVKWQEGQLLNDATDKDIKAFLAP